MTITHCATCGLRKRTCVCVYDAPAEGCSRDYLGPCEGSLFIRLSRSGMTSSTICEGHARQLEDELDGIAKRYPEINHPDGCGCYGCSDGSG